MADFCVSNFLMAVQPAECDLEDVSSYAFLQRHKSARGWGVRVLKRHERARAHTLARSLALHPLTRTGLVAASAAVDG